MSLSSDEKVLVAVAVVILIIAVSCYGFIGYLLLRVVNGLFPS